MIQAELGRTVESEEEVEIMGLKMRLTFVLNELDIMSLTVAMTLTFSAA